MILDAPKEGADERYLTHRLRATSLAAVVGATLAAALFGWHFFADDAHQWDLLAVVLAMAVVKPTALVWYRPTG